MNFKFINYFFDFFTLLYKVLLFYCEENGNLFGAISGDPIALYGVETCLDSATCKLKIPSYFGRIARKVMKISMIADFLKM